LAEDEDDFAVAVAIGVGKAGVDGERDVARDFLPQKAELVAGVPDVVAGGVDSVGIRRWVVAGAAGDDCGADVRLAVKDADGRVEGSCRAMEVGRGRNLLVGRGAGLRPVGHGWDGGLSEGGAGNRKSHDEQGCGKNS